jgi:DNA segregation ATPase FtsK/SpoIIIE-like protein
MDEEIYQKVVARTKEFGRMRITQIIQHFRVKYTEAARMMERMEEEGLVKQLMIKNKLYRVYIGD